MSHLTIEGISVSGSVGQTIPNTMAKIVDITTGKNIGPNQGEGELCIKGPQVKIIFMMIVKWCKNPTAY